MCDNPPFTKIVPTDNDTTTTFNYSNSTSISIPDMSLTVPTVSLSSTYKYYSCDTCTKRIGSKYTGYITTKYPCNCGNRTGRINLGRVNINQLGIPNPFSLTSQKVTIYPDVKFELTTNPTYWYNLYKLQEIIKSNQVQLSEYEYYFNYFLTSKPVIDETRFSTNYKDVIVVTEKTITETNVLLTSANRRYELFVNSYDGIVGIRDVQTYDPYTQTGLLPLGGVSINNFPGESTNFSVRLTKGNLQIFQTFFDYTRASKATYLLWESNSSGEADSSYFALLSDEGMLMVCKGIAPSTIESVLWNSQEKNMTVDDVTFPEGYFRANAELKTEQDGTTVDYYIRLRFGMSYSFIKGTTFRIEGVQNIFNCKEDITVQAGEPYDTGNLDDATTFFGAITQLLNGSEKPNTLYIVQNKPVPVSQLAITQMDTNINYSLHLPSLGTVNIPHKFVFDIKNAYFSTIPTNNSDFDLSLLLESAESVNLSVGSISMNSIDIKGVKITAGGAHVNVFAETESISINACMDPQFSLVLDILFGNTLSFSFTNNSSSSTSDGVLSINGTLKNPYQLTIGGGFNFKTTISGSIMGTNFGTNKSTDSSFNIVQSGDEIITINKTMTI